MTKPGASRWIKRVAIVVGVLTLLVVVGAGIGAAIVYDDFRTPNENVGATVSLSDRHMESAALEGLGAKLPEGGLVLEHPFREPINGRSFIVPGSWWPQGLRMLVSGRMDVRADHLLLDLDVLEMAMSRNYGGWESAERAGWNWQQWFADWRTMLRNAGTRELSVDEAFAPMDAYSAFRIDNHTNIPSARFTTSSLSQSARMAKRAAAPCTEVAASGRISPLRANDAGEQPRVAVSPNANWSSLDTASYIALPSRLGALERVHCGGEWIALAGGKVRSMSLLAILRSEMSSEAARVERLSDSAVYIRLPTFSASGYTHTKTTLALAPKPNGRETTLIVDVRDNGGGDASYAYPFLGPWVDLKRLPTFSDMRANRAMSCLYGAFRWNSARRNFNTSGGATGGTWLQPRIDSMLSPVPEGCPRETVAESGRVTYGKRGIRPDSGRLRILVWTNGGCGSDCEFLMAQLSQLSETVIVGTNSGGVMQFIQPGSSILPNTRLPFRMALGESDFYGDGRSVDGHGLDVDVLLPDEAHWKPLEVARLVSLIRPR